MFFLFDKPLNRDKTNCVLTTNQWCTLSTKTVIALDWDVNLDKNKPATGIYSYIISEKFVGVRIRPQSLFWFKWGLQYASLQIRPCTSAQMKSPLTLWGIIPYTVRQSDIPTLCSMCSTNTWPTCAQSPDPPHHRGTVCVQTCRN